MKENAGMPESTWMLFEFDQYGYKGTIMVLRGVDGRPRSMRVELNVMFLDRTTRALFSQFLQLINYGLVCDVPITAYIEQFTDSGWLMSFSANDTVAGPLAQVFDVIFRTLGEYYTWEPALAALRCPACGVIQEKAPNGYVPGHPCVGEPMFSVGPPQPKCDRCKHPLEIDSRRGWVCSNCLFAPRRVEPPPSSPVSESL